MAIIADPTLEGGSTGVNTPKLLERKDLVVTNKPQEFYPHLGLDSKLLVLGGPSNSSTSEKTTVRATHTRQLLVSKFLLLPAA